MSYNKGEIVYRIVHDGNLALYMVDDVSLTSETTLPLRSLRNGVGGAVVTSDTKRFWLQIGDMVTIGMSFGTISKITFNDQLQDWYVWLKVANKSSLQGYTLKECNNRLKFIDNGVQ